MVARLFPQFVSSMESRGLAVKRLAPHLLFRGSITWGGIGVGPGQVLVLHLDDWSKTERASRDAPAEGILFAF